MPKLMPWHQTQLIDPTYTRVDLVKEGANSRAHIKLFKAKGGNQMTLEEILKSLKPEHASVVQKALDDAQKAAEEAEIAKKAAEEEIAKLKNQPNPGDSPEEILKSVKDPAVKALLETQIAKTKAAEEAARIMKEKQVEAEAIAKAKEVPNIGAEEQTLVDIYKKLKDVDEKLCEDVFGIFKAASALAGESGAFKEIGKSINGTVVENSTSEEAAWAAIEKAADEIIAKDKSIAKSAAISKAIRENPDLYKAYLNAQRG